MLWRSPYPRSLAHDSAKAIAASGVPKAWSGAGNSSRLMLGGSRVRLTIAIGSNGSASGREMLVSTLNAGGIVYSSSSSSRAVIIMIPVSMVCVVAVGCNIDLVILISSRPGVVAVYDVILP